MHHFLQVKDREHQQEAHLNTQSQIKLPIFSLHTPTLPSLQHTSSCVWIMFRGLAPPLSEKMPESVALHLLTDPSSLLVLRMLQTLKEYLLTGWITKNTCKMVLNYTARHTPTNPRSNKALLAPTHQLLTVFFSFLIALIVITLLLL